MNTWKERVAVILAAATMLPLTALPAVAAGQGGGGGRPGGEELSGNNLSYPVVFTGERAALAGIENEATPGGTELGKTFSYGCNIPEKVGQYSYPNTSCLTTEGTYLDAEACALSKCIGQAVEPIFWQKTPVNVWQAGSAQVTPPATGVPLTNLEVGDNLESVAFASTSVIRIETVPFALVDPVEKAYEMWHVSGQGPSEMWGLHTTQARNPYVFMSPHAVAHTTAMRLNIAKLGRAAVTCPTKGPAMPDITATWTGTQWLGPEICTLRDIPFPTELNIKGSFTYGYNWKLKTDVLAGVCDGYAKAGWWRLTFRLPAGILDVDATTVLAPPEKPQAAPELMVAASEEEEETGPLFVARKDAAADIAFIDVCVTAARGGGGKARR